MPFGENQGAYTFLGIALLFVALLAFRLFRRRPMDPFRAGASREGTDLRSELERLAAEIRDISREEIARLDTKIRLLNQLLEECERKRLDLEALLARTEGGARPANPLHDQVYALQDSGKDPQEISSATGLEKGEVDLILGLRKIPPPPSGQHP